MTFFASGGRPAVVYLPRDLYRDATTDERLADAFFELYPNDANTVQLEAAAIKQAVDAPPADHATTYDV